MTGRSSGDGRPEVLVVLPYYLPGYRAGGPIRTISAMVERLSASFRFRVLTSDRDEGDTEPYAEAGTDRWVEQGSAEVRYLAPREQTLTRLRNVLGSLRPELLYLNGFYHPVFTFRVLLLRRIGLLRDIPALLVPRGHLSPGARSVKPWRKRAYISLVKILGLVDDVVFHASEDMEREEILDVFPEADVRVAPNMVPPLQPDSAGLEGWKGTGGRVSDGPRQLAKLPGRLRVLFLSRVAPKKNLTVLLEALREVSGAVRLSIVGPVADQAYWSTCRVLIEQLPASVQVDYRGPVPHRQVPGILAEHHLFVLPTRSENFGHVIREALQVGRPVLISDRTPWEGIEEAGAGWVCPLEDLSCFRKRMEQALAMDQRDFDARCRAARVYMKEVEEGWDVLNRNRSLLEDVMSHARPLSAT